MDKARITAIRDEALDHMAKWTPGLAEPRVPTAITVGELYGLAVLALKALEIAPVFADLLTSADNRHRDPRAFSEAIERAKVFARGLTST